MGPSFETTPLLLTGISEKRLTGRATSEPAAASEQPHDHQQNDGADRGIKDLAHQAGADGDAEPWKQQAGDQRAGDTDENIADDPKAGAPHDLSRQPACNQADEQNNEKAFIRQSHGNFPRWFTPFLRAAFEPIDNRLT